MFHPQSYLATTELIHRVLREAFGETKPSLCHALITFAFDLFHGKNPQFQPCDTAFHDFDHTMQATAAVVDLLAAHRQNPIIATLDQRDWELTIAAAILHDSGYLKRRNDSSGSGAKYSATSVAVVFTHGIFWGPSDSPATNFGRSRTPSAPRQSP
jgi:hypothetical protein